jgi:type 1 glutamine amidotransferase
MNNQNKISRRNVLKTGIAVAATATIASPKAYAAQFEKRPGETKIVCVMGDYWHNPVWQEQHVRGIFSSKSDFKVYFVLASRYMTAELLSDTDLLITTRYGGGDALGWSPEPIVGERPPSDVIWTDEHVNAVCDNVRNRGMGFLAAHCTLFCGRNEIEDLMGIEPQLHQEMQPMAYSWFNQDHPITKGMEPYYITLDDQFGVDFKYPSRTTILFKTQAVHDKREMVSAWCIEQGNGRVVGLLPGDHNFAYRVPEYQEIFWRAAYWAMKRDIPPYPNAVKDKKGFI